MNLFIHPLVSGAASTALPLTRHRAIALHITRVFVASSVFAFCFSKAIRNLIVVMPESAQTPGDQLLRFADEMWRWTTGLAVAFAFVSIHALALANRVITASIWRLFALVSPAGEVPRYSWFVQEMSSACVYAAVAILVTGLFFADLRPGTSPAALETLIADNAMSLLIVILGALILRRMRDHNLAIVDRDIWGGPARVSLALLAKVAVLLVALELFALASRAFLR